MTSVGALGLGALSMIAAAPAGAAADPGMTVSGGQELPVPLERAGEFVGWGQAAQGPLTPPASLAGVALREVAWASGVGFALTGDGRVVGWGQNQNGIQDVPAKVASMDVVDLAAGPNYGGVVSRSGQVFVWGQARPIGDPTDVPSGLSGVTQLALGQDDAYALKSDGTVVTWGQSHYGQKDVPEGLRAVAITAGAANAYALTVDGTVVGWGKSTSNSLALPAAVQQPGNVLAVAASSGSGAFALLADGTVVGWGTYGRHVPDPGGKKAVAIDSHGLLNTALDEDGEFHIGSPGGPVAVPAEANGLAVARFAVNDDGYGAGAMIVTKLLRAGLPAVAGAATVGATLTGTPGTFSASPDSVTSQWLADGAPIPGATGPTLPVTEALVGKQISYASTATKTGEDPVTSTSTPTAAVSATVPPSAAKVASSTKVAKVTVAKKAKKVTVTGTVTATKPSAGQATVVITKGKKTIVTKTVTVAADGTFQLVVKEFGKLAIKQTKPKGKKGAKAKGSYTGKYKITISYLGNTQVNPSTGEKGFTVKK